MCLRAIKRLQGERNAWQGHAPSPQLSDAAIRVAARALFQAFLHVALVRGATAVAGEDAPFVSLPGMTPAPQVIGVALLIAFTAGCDLRGSDIGRHDGQC